LRLALLGLLRATLLGLGAALFALLTLRGLALSLIALAALVLRRGLGLVAPALASGLVTLALAALHPLVALALLPLIALVLRALPGGLVPLLLTFATLGLPLLARTLLRFTLALLALLLLITWPLGLACRVLARRLAAFGCALPVLFLRTLLRLPAMILLPLLRGSAALRPSPALTAASRHVLG
jgi:hypothetical protein